MQEGFSFFRKCAAKVFFPIRELGQGETARETNVFSSFFALAALPQFCFMLVSLSKLVLFFDLLCCRPRDLLRCKLVGL